MRVTEAPQVRMAFDRGYVARQEIQRLGNMWSTWNWNCFQGINKLHQWIGTNQESNRDLYEIYDDLFNLI